MNPSRSRLVRSLAAAVLVCTALAAWGPALRSFLAPHPNPTQLFDEDMNSGVVQRADAIRVEGFVPCVDGWCLPAGASGTLTYSVSLPDGTRWARLQLWAYPPPSGQAAVDASLDEGRTFKRVSAGERLEGKVLEFRAPGRTPLVLRFTATNRSREECLVVDKFAGWSLDRGPAPATRCGDVVLAFSCVAFAAAFLTRRWRTAIVTAGLLSLAMYCRCGPFSASSAGTLDPDAQGYLHFAEVIGLFGSRGFYSGTFAEREPMFIFLAHFFLKLVGHSPYGLRLFSFTLSLAVVWIVTICGRRLLGNWAGAACGLLVAVNQPLAYEAARGLRLELEMLFWLAFLFATFLAKRPVGHARSLLVGAMGGVLVLTRSTYLPVVLPLQALVFFPRPVLRWRHVLQFAVAASLTVALVAPHRYGLYVHHGDPFWDTTKYARWNANVEFAGRPGYPSREQLQVNAYVGAPMTYREYMFGLHTLSDIAAGTVRGYWKLYRNFRIDRIPIQESWPSWLFNGALQLLAAAGFVLAFFRADCRWLPCAFLLAEWPPAFLYDRGLVEAFRHTYQGYPLVVMAAVLAASTAVSRVTAGSVTDELARRAPASLPK